MSPLLTSCLRVRREKFFLLRLAVLGVVILFFSFSCSKEDQAEKIRQRDLFNTAFSGIMCDYHRGGRVTNRQYVPLYLRLNRPRR